VKAARGWQIARLGALYDALGTDARERRRFPATASAATVEGLEREVAARAAERAAPGTQTELSIGSPSATRISREDLRSSAQQLFSPTAQASPVLTKSPGARRSPDPDRSEIARRSRDPFRR
jgi:hypothetical protein